MSQVAEKPVGTQHEFRNVHPFADLLNLCAQSEIILDCGAGAGYFAGECDKIFPGATVYSFEPVKDLFDRLVFSTKRMLNPRGASNVALTDTNGLTTINLTVGPKSNSLLPFLPGNPLDELTQVVGTEQVKGIRLDSWLDINSIPADKIGLLKLDVQGAELRLLEGCPNLLKHRPVILAEVSFQQQYEGQPLLDDIDEFLATRGYRRLYLYASVMPDVWGDAIYVPSERQVAGERMPVAARGGEPVRLNIGAGGTVIPGFTAIDRKFGSEAFPLNYPDGSVDEIRASHILEHFDFREVPKVLEDWKRVLKPGGRLRISVPDFSKISSVSATDPSWRFYLMGGQTDPDDYHKSAFDGPLLTQYLDNAGLVDVRPWVSPNTDSAANPISLNLEGYKATPDAPQSLKINIKAVMSVPRVGWNDASQAIDCMLRPFGIPMMRFNGVFWGQCMQRAFQECVDDGTDWILALDYDSMPTAKHLNDLMRAFGTHPEIDALAALQMRRGQDFPLLTRAGETETEITGDPLKVHTAHFGLTLIRVEALKTLPKPWFYAKPDAEGNWTDDRMDDDIWFWHQWRLAGKTIYVAPDVRIGHLELMVSEFDADMQPHHIPIRDWWKANGGK